MRRTYVAVLGTVVLIVAGCGDDKKTPTKAEYITKADAICSEGKTKSKVYSDQLDKLPQDAKLTDTVPAIEGGLKTTRTYQAKLKDLKRPSEDKATLDSYFGYLDQTITAGERLLAAVKTNDLKKVQTAGAANPQLKADRKRVARDFGFKHCA